MRISDWSSDVCSSDLLLGAAVVGQRLGYADLSGLDLLELFAFLHPARFMVPTPKGLARATGLLPPTRDEEVAPFLREAAAALLKVAEGDWRSEEHTSELQSLMRISYAVFCLKKKNKDKLENTYT